METTPNEFRNTVGDIKNSVKQNANSLRQNVEKQIEDSGWQERYEDIQKRARQAVDSSEEFVRSHPYYTLAGAAALGFVAAMLLRRK